MQNFLVISIGIEWGHWPGMKDEVLQRRVRIKIYINFISTKSFETLWTGRVKQTKVKAKNSRFG